MQLIYFPRTAINIDTTLIPQLHLASYPSLAHMAIVNYIALRREPKSSYDGIKSADWQ